MTKFLYGIMFTLFGVAVLGAAPVRNANVEVELISEVQSIKPGQPFWVAVRMDMDQGWHTYWKNPGDSGLATRIQWTLPEGFTAGPLQWPYPERFQEANLATYGYSDEVFLWTEITPAYTIEEGTIQKIQAKVRWLSCEKVCVPGQAEVELALSIENESRRESERTDDRLAVARQRLPGKGSGWNVEAVDLGRVLHLELIPPDKDSIELKEVYFFPERNDLLDHTAPQKLKRTSRGYELSIGRSTIVSHFSQLRGVLVSEKGWTGQNQLKAIEVDVPVARK